MISAPKGPAPVCLTTLAATPNADWDSVHGDQKQAVRDALVRDQGALCAYCQRRVHATEAAMRIDHWHSRSAGGGIFEWNNLIGSCADKRTCDAAKHEEHLFLNPVRDRGPDPRRFLRYLGDGSISAEDPRAQADLRILRLNERHLVRARRQLLDALREWIRRHEPTIAELQRQIASLETPTGEAPEHATTRAYHLRRWLRARGQPAPQF